MLSSLLADKAPSGDLTPSVPELVTETSTLPVFFVSFETFLLHI